MRKVLVIMGMALLAILPAAASEQSDAMAVVHQFVDGFNKGDANMSAATCAEQVSIIDDFPPYYWRGSLLDLGAGLRRVGKAERRHRGHSHP